MKRNKCQKKSEAKMQTERAAKYPTLCTEIRKVTSENDPLMILEPEIKQEFHSSIDEIKCEEAKIKVARFETLFIEPNDLSVNYEAQKSRQRFAFCKVSSELTDDNASPLICRLCATQGNDMVYIFGTNELHKNIMKKIEHCLPIMVRETDTLPKQACQTCLAKLELCYQFRNSVAEAEKQLLMSSRQPSGRLEETEEYCRAFPLCSGQRDDAKETADDDREMEISSESETNLEEQLQTDTVVEDHVVSSQSTLQSKRSLPTEIYPAHNSGEDWNTNRSNNEQDEEIENSLHSGKTSASSVKQSSSHSALNILPMHVEYLKEEIKSNSEVSDSEPDKLDNSPRRDYREDSCDDGFLFCKTEFDAPSSAGKTVKCRICGAAFENADECYLHTSEHESTNHYPCCLCDNTSTTERGWRRHYLEHTEGEKRRSAAVEKSSDKSENTFITQLKQKFYKLCQTSSAKPERIPAELIKAQENPNADQKKNDRAVQCTLCKKTFHPDLLEAHIESCGNQAFRSLIHAKKKKKKKRYLCEHCGETFSQKKYIAVHIRNHTKKQKSSTSEKHLSDMKSQPRNEEIKQEKLSERYHAFECTVCDEKFYTEDQTQMEVHLESCSGPLLQIKDLTCHNCKKEFADEVDLAAHIITHIEDRPYGCKFCSIKFKLSSGSDEHRKIHIAQNLYRCSICEGTFKSLSILKSHAKTHPKFKLYNCRLCSAQFATIIERDNHLATHTKSRPYRPDVCGNKSSTRYNLRRQEGNRDEEIADNN